MKIGVCAVLLGDRPLDKALEYFKNAGIEATEIGAGGYPGKAHCDPAKLLAVGQAFSAVQQDETASLIRALKPHLSDARAKRADQAIRMLRLYAAAGILREKGVLADLFGSDPQT